jgi:hypothetical protein
MSDMFISPKTWVATIKTMHESASNQMGKLG